MKLKVVAVAAALPIAATVAFAQAPAAGPTSTTQVTAAAPVWYQRQTGEFRSSKLVGTKVQNNAGDHIGDINEIVLTRDGSAAAAIIGVGGFLGMGEREVAVQFKSLQISQDSSGNDVVKLDTTKDALKSAPAWTWQSS